MILIFSLNKTALYRCSCYKSTAFFPIFLARSVFDATVGRICFCRNDLRNGINPGKEKGQAAFWGFIEGGFQGETL